MLVEGDKPVKYNVGQKMINTFLKKFERKRKVSRGLWIRSKAADVLEQPRRVLVRRLHLSTGLKKAWEKSSPGRREGRCVGYGRSTLTMLEGQGTVCLEWNE